MVCMSLQAKHMYKNEISPKKKNRRVVVVTNGYVRMACKSKNLTKKKGKTR